LYSMVRRGDLNPHEIAPASTSSERRLYRGVLQTDKSLILRDGRFARYRRLSRNHFNSTTVIRR
jgi:hypothetical protein